jgi:hypothetical protein
MRREVVTTGRSRKLPATGTDRTKETSMQLRTRILVPLTLAIAATVGACGNDNMVRGQAGSDAGLPFNPTPPAFVRDVGVPLNPTPALIR